MRSFKLKCSKQAILLPEYLKEMETAHTFQMDLNSRMVEIFENENFQPTAINANIP